MKRKVIEIDEERCTGCGACIPGCPEGALQVIDGKARLISDLFCDGLGACIGECPTGAMNVVEREAEPYDEKKVMENIIKAGPNTISAHLKHLEDHGELTLLNQAKEVLESKGIPTPEKPSACNCPGTAPKSSAPKEVAQNSNESALSQWPVQLRLLPVKAQFFEGADLLIAADCVPFADANFHSDLLSGKRLIIGCPKFDEPMVEKLTEIFKSNDIRSISVAIMEVPCCNGLLFQVQEALADSGKNLSIEKKIISIPR